MSLFGVGCFLLGGATGLALSKDESDIFDENCIKLEDLDENCIDDISEKVVTESRESYDRMVKEVYGNAPIEAYLDDEEDYDDYEDEEEIEDPENNILRTSIEEIDVDGDPVQVKLTSEGMLEVIPPYVISQEEYFDETQFVNFDKECLVYYEEDETLSTERDEVIYNVEEVIGEDALDNFGCNSGSHNLVYVRNVRLETDYEITKDDGSYKETVLGFSDDEIDYKKAREFFKKFDEEREE